MYVGDHTSPLGSAPLWRIKNPPPKVFWPLTSHVVPLTSHVVPLTSHVVSVGLRGRLDYVESLGVDALVISSVLDGNHGDAFTGSADVGYQVVNYSNVDALFGDLQDMGDLITEAHDRGNMSLKH